MRWKLMNEADNLVFGKTRRHIGFLIYNLAIYNKQD